MSKDFTPYELYRIDREFVERGGQSLRVLGITLNNGDASRGKSTKESGHTILKNLQGTFSRRQYKELGFLFDNFYMAYKVMYKHPKLRKQVLDSIEKQLREIERQQNTEDNSIVGLWFYGKLDPNFYSNTENNELFFEYIMKEYNRLIDENYSLNRE